MKNLVPRGPWPVARQGLWAIVLLGSLATGHGRLYASGEPDAFALTPIGARAGGMGNAFIGLSDEIESVCYNPAGLGNLVQSGVTAMYQTPMLQTSRSFLAGNWRWAHPRYPGSVGFGWLRLGSSDIELTNSNEQVVGTDKLTNDLFLLGAGVHPFEHISLGATVKYFRFAFNGFSESGFGVDAGAHAQYYPFRFGAALTDIGGTMLSGSSIASGAPDVKDKVPMRFRPGAAVTWRDPFGLPVRLLADVDALMKLQGAQEARIFAGGELWGFDDHAAFRTGFMEGNGPTLGFALRAWMLQIDYAFLFSQNLQDEHRISTTVRF